MKAPSCELSSNQPHAYSGNPLRRAGILAESASALIWLGVDPSVTSVHFLGLTIDLSLSVMACSSTVDSVLSKNANDLAKELEVGLLSYFQIRPDLSRSSV